MTTARVKQGTMTGLSKKKSNWFDERRELFFTKMVRGFHETFSCFLSIYEQYLAKNLITFDTFQKLVGSESEKGFLWRLKDSCHQLWRGDDQKIDINGCIFDWVIGSLFHEAMKLKENIYIHEYYGPLADEMRNKHQESTVKFCGAECRMFMEKNASEIGHQIENIGSMFGRATYLLRTIMPDHRSNSLLLRFFMENEHITDKLWSETLKDFFTDIFGTAERGYCAAARSYIQGQWYEKASTAYEKALLENKNCIEAHNFILQQPTFIEKTRHNGAKII